MEIALEDNIYVFWIVWIVMAGFLVDALWRLIYGIKSKTWKGINATVTSSEVVKNFWSDDDDQDSYSPKIKYMYTVGGRRYSGGRYSYKWWGTPNYGEVATIIKDYGNKGKIVTYYNPSNPSQSVILPGINSLNLLSVGIFMAVVIGMTYQAYSNV
jgi:hypothetical protein